MSKFKLFVVIIILIAIGYGGYKIFEQQLTPVPQINDDTSIAQFIEANDILWYQDKDKTINLALFSKPFEFVFSPENAQDLKEQSLLNSYVLAVNGSFYRGSILSAEHAGLLIQEGEMIEPMVGDDNQVTHVVVYDTEEENLEFVSTKEINLDEYSNDKYLLFQTGPILIINNEIQEEVISQSQNGNSRYLRTVLGYTSDGQKFILITRIGFTLKELSETILNMDVFSDKKINLINLDGGSSVSMYSRSLTNFNFLETKRLPIVIGVK